MLDFLKRSHETTRQEKPSLAYIYCMNTHMFNLAAECRQNLCKRKGANKNSISNSYQNENHHSGGDQIISKNEWADYYYSY